jgi:hypothetical protein
MPIIETSIAEGTGLRGGLNVAVGKYSFAVDGGAAGTIGLMGATGIPSGSTILGGFLQVDTAVTGVGASVAIQVEAANDIVSAAAISGAPWSTTGRKVIVPVFTVATEVVTTAARDISAVISAADLTAGVFRVVLIYVGPVAA